ncbi:MAG: acetyltransferase [Planctomycetota bacterium]
MANRNQNPLPEGRGSLILLGGGGHAKVILDAAITSGFRVLGVYDDDPHAPLGGVLPHLGPIDDGLTHLESNPEPAGILAIGDLRAREDVIESADPAINWATVVHPGAWVSPGAAIGAGSFIGAGAIVQADAAIGPHATINTGAVVEHDCTLGENVHLAPRAALGGNVRIGDHSLVGIGASVKPAITIGAHAIVGVGSAVIHDVGEHTTVVGVPARAHSGAVSVSS